jgi:ABC-2 type transport system permease protein
MTYAVDAMQEVTSAATVTGTYARDAVVVGTCAVAALVLGAVTLRRRTA